MRSSSVPMAFHPQSGKPPERKLQVIDATCPLVTKVHLEAIRYSREGYTIILIGHSGHDEIIGTIGEAPNNIVLVEVPEDVELLQLEDRRKLACLTQTTLSVDEASTIVREASSAIPAPGVTSKGRYLLRHDESSGCDQINSEVRRPVDLLLAARTVPTVADYWKKVSRRVCPVIWWMAAETFSWSGLPTSRPSS